MEGAAAMEGGSTHYEVLTEPQVNTDHLKTQIRRKNRTARSTSAGCQAARAQRRQLPLPTHTHRQTACPSRHVLHTWAGREEEGCLTSDTDTSFWNLSEVSATPERGFLPTTAVSVLTFRRTASITAAPPVYQATSAPSITYGYRLFTINTSRTSTLSALVTKHGANNNYYKLSLGRGEGEGDITHLNGISVRSCSPPTLFLSSKVNWVNLARCLASYGYRTSDQPASGLTSFTLSSTATDYYTHDRTRHITWPVTARNMQTRATPR
ncbi:hypothetical protein C0Q70_02093 [Pomacea canaliculata]|uniref:Uncharacterized protein n=1 Tax=Pomacea canaliculata TaxID=400727 RepID=A0A2T7Q1C1_POMCA|nr:hypothetical protein C0Q70_02093 [Pomacea canaliculata]